LQTNFFTPSQKLVDKHREGAKVTKRYDTAATPYQRVLADPAVSKKTKTALTWQYQGLNPAQIRRDMLDFPDQLLNLVRAKHPPTRLPVKPPTATRAKSDEATKDRSGASRREATGGYRPRTSTSVQSCSTMVFGPLGSHRGPNDLV